MVDEHAQAVSVANRYFVLADNLLPGFKDHLAKHVTFKWFGQNIEGRDNVADFMLSNKKNSIHIFSNIKPTSGITRETKVPYRRKRHFLEQNINVEEAKYNIYTSNCSRQEASCEKCGISTTHENMKDIKKFERTQENDADDMNLVQKNFDTYKSPNETGDMNVSTGCDYVDDHVDKNRNDTNATIELNDECYNLNESDLRNLFEPEITSQTVEEIQNINRIKLKEEMAPTIRVINRERVQEDSPTVVETGTIKYLEAIGKIKLLQRKMSEDSAFGYYWPRRINIWKRKCKVQIAYSIVTADKSSKIAEKDYKLGNIHSSHSTIVQRDAEEKEKNTEKDMEEKEKNIEKDKLPSVEEFVRANNTLIPDMNYFNGYLKPVNFFDDRNEFLKNFEAQIKHDNPNMHSFIRFKKNELIFNYPNKASFYVTYQIHMIVYTILRKDKIQKTLKEKKLSQMEE